MTKDKKNNDVHQKIIYDITNAQKDKDLSSLVKETARALMTNLDADLCFYCTLKAGGKKIKKFEMSSGRILESETDRSQHCLAKVRDEKKRRIDKGYVPCEKMEKKLLRLRIFSHFPQKELKEQEFVDVKKEDIKALHSVYCLDTKEDQVKLESDQIEAIEDCLDFVFSYAISSEQHEAWHHVFQEIRRIKEKPITSVYARAFSALKVLNIPIMYGNILLYAETDSETGINESYLMRQRAYISPAHLKGRTANLVDVCIIPLDEAHPSYEDKELPSTVVWANKWNQRYNNNPSVEFEYAITPKEKVLLASEGMMNLDFSYVVTFPILRDKELPLTFPLEDEKCFRGLGMLFVSREHHDLSIFRSKHLKHLSHVINSAIRTSRLYTFREQIFNTVSKNSRLMLTGRKEFEKNIFREIGKKLFHVDALEIRELDENNRMKPKPLFRFVKKNKIGEQELMNNVTEVDLTDKECLYLYKENEHSILIERIKSPDSIISLEGAIVCKNRRCSANLEIIIPFCNEDRIFARELGNYLMTLYSSMREQEILLNMSNVLNHEIANSVDGLYKRLYYLQGCLPIDLSSSNQAKLAIKNIGENIDLLASHVVWPKIFSGNYIVKKTKVPVLSIMNKWRSIYFEKMRKNHLLVHIPSIEPERSPKPLADHDLLELAISNLIKNAVTYAHKGSVISCDSKKVFNEKYGSHVRVEISDYGFGIEEKEKEWIFDLFYRSPRAKERTGADEGQGAGLYVVKACVEEHGWPDIAVECRLFCELNAPLLFWIAHNGKWNMIEEEELREKAKSTYQNRGEEIKKMTNSRYSSYKWNEWFQYNIDDPTYFVKFTLIIPEE